MTEANVAAREDHRLVFLVTVCVLASTSLVVAVWTWGAAPWKWGFPVSGLPGGFRGQGWLPDGIRQALFRQLHDPVPLLIRPNLGLEVLLQSVFRGFAVFVVLLVLRGERQPLRSIGLRRPDRSTAATAPLLFQTGFLLEPLVEGPLVKGGGSQVRTPELQRLRHCPRGFG